MIIALQVHSENEDSGEVFDGCIGHYKGVKAASNALKEAFSENPTDIFRFIKMPDETSACTECGEDFKLVPVSA